MKVLMVNTLYHPYGTGGAERSTQHLAEGLVEKGHRVSVLCTMPKSGWTVENQNGVKVYYAGLENVYWPYDKEETPTLLKPVWHAIDSLNPWMEKKVETVLRREGPDVLHTHNLGGFSVSAWRAGDKESTPIVHTARDYALLCPKNMFWKGENCSGRCYKCRAFTISRRKESSRVDGAVGISRFVLRRHESLGYFGEAKKKVIYNPVNVKKISPQKESVNQDLRLGFLGRISEKKGVRRMIEAIDFQKNDVELRVGGIGEKQYEQEIKRIAEGKPVTFLGFVDPTAFFKTVDVLVVPSVWHEPFGRVVVEAYAHSTPVIAADRGGLPEIVRDGKTGFTYNPDAPDTLNGHIESFMDKEWLVERIGKRAREEAEKYDLDSHVEEYTEIYRKVV